MPFRFRAVALAAACSLPLATAAFAHVVTDPDEGPAGGYFRTVFRVTHGCKGSPTIALNVRIPDGVILVRPQPKPGWTLDLRLRRVDPPLRGPHGIEITQTVVEVTWRGGPLADAHFDDFALIMRLPERPGATLHFPVVQTCEGSAHNWVTIPAEGQKRSDIPEPAPFVRLRAP